MKEILFIRHGESIVNITKEFSYKRIDKPLTSKGVQQAIQTGEFLNSKGYCNAIFTSPLLRAKETAQKIRSKLEYDIDLIVHEPLRELNIGILEDMGATKEAWDLFYQITRDWEHDADRKFPGGESLNELQNRFKQGLLEILEWMDEQDASRVIVVAHGGILYSSLRKLFVVNDAIPIDFEVPNCSITTIQIDENLSKWAISSLTNFDHLYGEARKLEKGTPDDDEFD